MSHIDNRLFEKDNMNHDEDEMDQDVQEPSTSHYVECQYAVESPNFLEFEAPSGTFRSIDWTAANFVGVFCITGTKEHSKNR